MRTLFVVQRYGEDIVGGAEAHARILAEKLHRDCGWDITVLTSAAKSYLTWANEYPVGDSELRGVKVKRFRTWMPRSPGFGFLSRVLLKLRRVSETWHLTGVSRLLESVWIKLQGPYTPGLLSFLKRHSADYDATVFFTYLYYPTVFGLQVAANKVLFVPTAHDEAPFYFHHTRDSFARAHHILANSESERELIKRITPSSKVIGIAGLGIDTDLLTGGASKGDYILYLGRLSRGKGVDKLISWFKKANPATSLFLAGVKEDGVDWGDDQRIRYLGVLSDADKVKYIRQARAMVNPSPLESLSLIVLEAASCCIPILVNRECEIFRYYEEEMATVFGFQSYESFEASLSKVLGTDWTTVENRSLLENSRRWVQDRYSWAAVLNKFKEASEERRSDGH